MMTIQEIDKILATCARKLERQQYAVDQTTREIAAWNDLRAAKVKDLAKTK